MTANFCYFCLWQVFFFFSAISSPSIERSQMLHCVICFRERDIRSWFVKLWLYELEQAMKMIFNIIIIIINIILYHWTQVAKGYSSHFTYSNTMCRRHTRFHVDKLNNIFFPHFPSHQLSYLLIGWHCIDFVSTLLLHISTTFVECAGDHIPLRSSDWRVWSVSHRVWGSFEYVVQVQQKTLAIQCNSMHEHSRSRRNNSVTK